MIDCLLIHLYSFFRSCFEAFKKHLTYLHRKMSFPLLSLVESICLPSPRGRKIRLVCIRNLPIQAWVDLSCFGALYVPTEDRGDAVYIGRNQGKVMILKKFPSVTGLTYSVSTGADGNFTYTLISTDIEFIVCALQVHTITNLVVPTHA